MQTDPDTLLYLTRAATGTPALLRADTHEGHILTAQAWIDEEQEKFHCVVRYWRCDN